MCARAVSALASYPGLTEPWQANCRGNWSSVLFAVIPAGGKSARMGRCKLALPLGDRTVLTWLLKSLAAGGVDRAVVVIGPHLPELIPLAVEAGADVYLLPQETA